MRDFFKKILISLLCLSVLMPAAIHAEEELTVDLPYTVNTDTRVSVQMVSPVVGEPVFTDLPKGSGDLIIKVPKEVGNFKYLIKQALEDDDLVEYDPTEYSLYTAVIWDENEELKVTFALQEGDNDPKPTEISFTNTEKEQIPQAVGVVFYKVNEDDEMLPGVSFQILQDNEVKYEYVSEETKTRLEIIPGEYTLHEVAPLEGFAPIEDVNFIVNEDASVVVADYVYVIADDEFAIKIINPKLPEPKKGSVLVEHRDADTGEVLKPAEYVIEDGEIGIPYETHTEDFPDYYFVKLADDSDPANGTNEERTQFVIYLYRKVKKGSVLVEHRDADTGEVLKPAEYVIEDGEVGIPYETHTEEFPNYEFVKLDDNSDPANGRNEERTQFVIYLYRKVSGSVTVEHKDIDTGEVLKPTEYVKENAPVGEEYTTHTEEFPEYEFVKLDDESAPAEGEVEKGTKHVIYLYRKKVTPPDPEPKKGSVLVEHRDADTGEVLKPEEYVCKDCEIGVPYETHVESFPDYEFVKLDDESDPAKGTNEERTQHVIYLYRKIKKGSVLVEHRDADTGAILKPAEYVQKDQKIGTLYDTHTENFDGYEFVRMDASSAPKSGSVTEKEQLVIYLYSKKPVPVKKGSVLVEHRDADTGEILKVAEYVLKDEEIGKAYSTSQGNFSGYTFVRMHADSAPASGVVKEGTQLVVYLYSKNPIKPTVVTGAGDMIPIIAGVSMLSLLGLLIILKKKVANS